MSFFPFIESIFYLSLGIIVILIFLIVFHFKQRIESLEKKGFLLTEMYNNLVKEFSIMKTVVYSPPAVQQKQNIVFSTQPPELSAQDQTYKKIIVMDKLSEVDEDTDLDSDSSDSDSESDSGSLEVVEINEETVDLDLAEPESTINVLKLEPEPTLDIEPESEPEPTPNPVNYTKLNLNELKMLVISKGLSTNPNKLKRSELLKLLEEETV